FISSRRRHTRFSRDWSSDVCSSDLKAGKTRGPIHRCDGQEAVGIGATAALEKTDYVTTTHRGHAHYIGKGLDPRRVMAEIMGRRSEERRVGKEIGIRWMMVDEDKIV